MEMLNFQTYILPRYSDELAAHAYQTLRDQAGKSLWDYLYMHSEQSFTVIIHEETKQGILVPDYSFRVTQYTIYLELIACQRQYLPVMLPAYEDLSFKMVSMSAIDEVKRRIKDWVRNLWTHPLK